MGQAYALARQAGFDPASAVIVAAIGAAESGLDPAAVGDVELQNSTWGPSVGVLQIRTLKRDTGTGRLRDIGTLSDPLANFRAAYEISGHGRDFSPWSVYTSGKYRQFVGQAGGAADASPVAYLPGAGMVPVGWKEDAAAAVGGYLVLGVAVVLGVVLVVAGAARTTGAGSAVGRLAGFVPVVGGLVRK